MKHARQTIADLEARLQELNAESQKIRSAINCLYEVMGEKPKYDEVEEKSSQIAMLISDEYYGKPLATVVKQVLEKRKAAGRGAARLDEIYEQLVAGGCKLTGKNEAIKKRGLAISMSKNQKFHKLPNDTWGLTEWYPSAKESRERNAQLKIEEKPPMKQQEDVSDKIETS
jgi:DNA-directed RNA polymerase delta subunit